MSHEPRAAGFRFRFECTTCGSEHEGLPDLAVDEPLPWTEASLEARASGELTSEHCILGESRFVRCVLELPIAGSEVVFAYGVWVSLSQQNFDRFREIDGRDRGLGDGPWFGWLSIRLPHYPDTFCLKTRVHLRPPPLRPWVELEPTHHPLAREQRLGIKAERIKSIIERTLHPERAAAVEAPRFMDCGTHGEGHACFVCQHLAKGDGRGFFQADDPDEPWPNAWCATCDDVYTRAGGWTDEAEDFAGITVVCHGCYEALAAKSRKLPS